MTEKPDETQPKVGYIPKPPSKADIDQVSQDQALITDEWADDEAGVAATITGQWTLGYDFTVVSQHDLEKGEMQFGLPAALVVLLLVFGAVVAVGAIIFLVVHLTGGGMAGMH